MENQKMRPRTMTKADVPTTCPHCNCELAVGDEVYCEPDAPASPFDAQRMREGRSYGVIAKLAHWACNPRARTLADASFVNLDMTG
jgi:hypothetical protein